MNKDKKSFMRMLLIPAAIVASSLAVMGDETTTEPKTGTPNQENTVTVEGTATLYGDWACKAPASLRVLPGEALPPVPGFPGGIQKAVVDVSVKALDCGDSTMNKHLRKALKEKDHPNILFQMNRYELSGNGGKATAFGELTIAGETKPVEMEVDLEALANQGVRATGEVPIKMKEYGVKPPSLLFGTLKVANDITVKFDSLVQPPNKP